MPVDNLDGSMVGVSYFGDMGLTNPVIVSPDAGGVYRAKQFRDGLAKKYDIEAGLAMIVKQKTKDNEIKGMDLVGSVKDCDVILGKPLNFLDFNAKFDCWWQWLTWWTLQALCARPPTS